MLYSRKFSGPINEAANIFSELQSALAAAERVFKLIDEEPERADRADAEELTEVRGDVRLEHISFGYEPKKTIIHDLSFQAQPGRLIAIVGPTGAGKTTLINLLMRFYDPDSGRILVDEKQTDTLTRKSLRQAYAMVLQDTWLFSGSIYENLAYGKEGASREEVEAAAKAAHIHSFIKRLPEEYDTVLTDEGTNISKGQKQLLTIGHASGCQNVDSGRGNLQCGYPHGTTDSKGYAETNGGKNLFCHCSQTFHHRTRGFNSGDQRRRSGGTGHSPGTDGTRRRVQKIV